MTTTPDLTRIWWLLAKHLEGMREPCPWTHSEPLDIIYHNMDSFYQVISCEVAGCSGYQSVPLTAGGLIDVGRLMGAIQTERGQIGYWSGRFGGMWSVRLSHQPLEEQGEDDDLATAFLKAKGVWPE